jgi:chromosome segregation ATPase
MPLASNPHQRVLDPVLSGQTQYIQQQQRFPTRSTTANTPTGYSSANVASAAAPQTGPHGGGLNSSTVLAAARTVRDTPGLATALFSQLGLVPPHHPGDARLNPPRRTAFGPPRLHATANASFSRASSLPKPPVLGSQPGAENSRSAAEEVLVVDVPTRLAECAECVSAACDAGDDQSLGPVRGALRLVVDTLSSVSLDVTGATAALVESHNSDLAQWVAAAVGELEQLRALVTHAQDDADAARNRAGAAEAQLEKANADAAPLHAQLVAARKQAASAQAAARAATDRLAGVQAQLGGELAAEHSSMAERIEELVVQNGELAAQRDVAVRERDAAHEAAQRGVEHSLREAREAYRRQVALLEGENSTLRGRIEQLTSVAAQAQGASLVAAEAAEAAHEALSCEVEAVARAQAEAEEATDVALGAQTQAAEWREDASALREQLRGLQSELEGRAGEVRHLQKQLADTHAQLAGALARASAAEAGAAESRDACEAAQAQATHWAATCDQQRAALDAAETQLAGLRGTVAQLSSELSACRSDVDAARQARDSCFGTVEGMQRAARADVAHAQQAACDAAVALAAAKAEAEAAWRRVRELDAGRGEDLARAVAAETALQATEGRVNALVRALHGASLPA